MLMFLSITTETGVKNINIYELQSYKSIDDETGKFIYYILDNGLTYKEYFDSDSDRDEKLSAISSMDPGTALVDSKIAEAIEHLDITTRVIVDSLPTEDISTKTIYMVPNSTPGVQSNTYDEYMYINNTWELIGSTAIDMTQYLSKTNTTSYTPTGDYNPATKKYVDDSAVGIITNAEIDEILNPTITPTLDLGTFEPDSPNYGKYDLVEATYWTNLADVVGEDTPFSCIIIDEEGVEHQDDTAYVLFNSGSLTYYFTCGSTDIQLDIILVTEDVPTGDMILSYME